MAQYGVLAVFDHNVQSWKTFKSRLAQWFIANDIDNTKDPADIKKRAILLSTLSDGTYKLAADLALPKDLQDVPYKDILNLLDKHFVPTKCGFGERYHFYSATQQSEETFTQWAARLRGLTVDCAFLNVEEALRDRFVMGMRPGAERDKLFAQNLEELTLAKAIDLAESVRSARVCSATTSICRTLNHDEQLFKITKPVKDNIKSCAVCGYKNHTTSQCKFANYKCKRCNTKGHLKRMCKKVNFVHSSEIGESDDDEQCRLDVRTPVPGKRGGKTREAGSLGPRARSAARRSTLPDACALAHAGTRRARRGVTFSESTADGNTATVTEFQCQKVRVREFYIAMQRCPYIHEMKERLLGAPVEPEQREAPRVEPQDTQVGTIVKLNSDGYGSHTSPARAPLVTDECDAAPDEIEALTPTETVLRYRACCQPETTPKNAKTSLFIISSFIYAKLLVVVCVAYVISDVITHNLPLYYYEGFFTYLYGMSILFLLYVFCFLLQESACCSGSPPKPKPPPKVKKPKKEKEKKTKDKEPKEGKDGKEDKDGKKDKKDGKSKEKGKDKDADKDKNSKESKKQSFQEVYPRKMRDKVRQQQLQLQMAQLYASDQQQQQQQQQQDIVELEAGPVARPVRRRKTSQNDHSHGSFFLRIGAIAFGLGTMIYNGLEFGTFFELPLDSPCYLILKGVNPVLQMVFTFMQMYFIFMNSRLNIHRFKVIARFGLMHVVATNICVWIRTLVLESLKEITDYHVKYPQGFSGEGVLGKVIRKHTLRHSGKVFGAASTVATNIASTVINTAKTTGEQLMNGATASSTAVPITDPTTTTTTIASYHNMGEGFLPKSKLIDTIKSTIGYENGVEYGREYREWPNDNPFTTTSFAPLATESHKVTQTQTAMLEVFQWLHTSTLKPIINTISTMMPSTTSGRIVTDRDEWGNNVESYRVDEPPHSPVPNSSEIFESYDAISPAALIANIDNSTVCGRNPIMGTIVTDSAPYLYPFIIEYSLIGAAVIYVMWKHIGRYPSVANDEDLERRLEAVLSRRAAALAAAQRGNRVDCAGASKGLFCGLLLLVASLICLILFFVLIRHQELKRLSIYLADVSHCALMVLSILAILIGFIRGRVMKWSYTPSSCTEPLRRVQSLKFRSEEQSDLNDILLRVSAFGLFVYAVFSVIAGGMGAFTHEPNLLVMITGCLSVLQVVLQLLFIADVSRRRVHLPEQERSKPARQAVTFLLICNVTMWLIYTFEAQKVLANPVQLDFYGFVAWSLVQRFTLPLCIFHRFHSAVTLAEIWKTSYKARLE